MVEGDDEDRRRRGFVMACRDDDDEEEQMFKLLLRRCKEAIEKDSVREIIEAWTRRTMLTTARFDNDELIIATIFLPICSVCRRRVNDSSVV